MSPLSIPVNRKRFPYGAATLTYVTGLCIFWLAKGRIDDTPINTWFERSVYFILIFFFCQAAIRAWADYLYNRFNKHSSITLSDDGIDDQSSIYAMRKIVWQDISDIEIKKKLGINLLYIRLHNPAAHISGQVLWKRIVLRRWLKRWGSPVIISQRRLDYDLFELKTLLIDRKAACGSR